ncbi:MAG: enoyl-CoA hydratase/isomerase family protein [Bacteroidetes bacterium]|nr:enoyl-CoA hydratase/isomerase family protein [Bacteroidota bacterium]
MSKEKGFAFQNDEIRFYTDVNVAVMVFHSNTFETLSNMEKSGQVLSVCEWLEEDPVINCLLILNDEGAFDETAYDNFMLGLQTGEDSFSQNHITTEKKLIRARQMNTFRNFIMKMVEYKKLFIQGLQGNIVTPFFGMSLCADFRFAAEDLRFVLNHNKYGMHPTGALPFFLPRFVGQSKATEILYTCRDINSEQALTSGIVNEIIPNEDFEKLCVQSAKNLCCLDPNVLKLTKRFINNYHDDLEKYFDIESKAIGF